MNKIKLFSFTIVFITHTLFAADLHPVHQWVTDSLKAHNAAATYADWELSGQTPEDIWKKIASDQDAKSAYCRALSRLSSGHLMVFYASLAEHTTELKCGRLLIAQVDTYLLQRKAAMTVRVMNEARLQNAPSYSANATLGPTREIELDTLDGPRLVNGPLAANEILFTFDDGPHSQLTRRLLDILEAEDIAATFFVVGKNVLAHPDVVREVADRGHIIANHSYSHKNLPKLSRENAMREINRGFDAIFSVLGFSAPYLRFPYGASTSYLRAEMKTSHIAEYFWAIDTLDWKKKDPDELLNYALRQTKEAGRGIVLFHDIQPQTIAMMPHYLAALKVLSFKPVILKPKEWMQNREVILGQNR